MLISLNGVIIYNNNVNSKAVGKLQRRKIGGWRKEGLLALESFGETVFVRMNKSEKPYMFSANDETVCD